MILRALQSLLVIAALAAAGGTRAADATVAAEMDGAELVMPVPEGYGSTATLAPKWFRGRVVYAQRGIELVEVLMPLDCFADLYASGCGTTYWLYAADQRMGLADWYGFRDGMLSELADTGKMRANAVRRSVEERAARAGAPGSIVMDTERGILTFALDDPYSVRFRLASPTLFRDDGDEYRQWKLNAQTLLHGRVVYVVLERAFPTGASSAEALAEMEVELDAYLDGLHALNPMESPR